MTRMAGVSDWDPLFDADPQAPLHGGPADTAAIPIVSENDETEVAGRAYVLTGGRTGGGRADVGLETLVMRAGPARPGQRMLWEHECILMVCDRPVAVAEVAARTGMPVGVVRVLVGDLVDDGVLTSSRRDVRLQEDIAFLERLIDRVSAL